jgi:hypothetical protein
MSNDKMERIVGDAALRARHAARYECAVCTGIGCAAGAVLFAATYFMGFSGIVIALATYWGGGAVTVAAIRYRAGRQPPEVRQFTDSFWRGFRDGLALGPVRRWWRSR